MIDAMAIRKQIEYDAHTGEFTGFVDLGNNVTHDDEAKEALVFMLVGMRSHWKAPVAYFLTNTLTAETQAQLVLHCLEEIADLGFVVHTLTMDRLASNRSMATILGCNMAIETLRPYFCIPGREDRVYLVFDACHMVKLVRNLLQAFQTIKSPDGVVMWDYIKDLNNTQEDLGLRFANKLSRRHTEFHQQKMKVSLAVQTLSNSVAAAIQTLEELGVTKFQGSRPTVEFIKVIRLCSA